MTRTRRKLAVLGAATLAGKELADRLVGAGVAREDVLLVEPGSDVARIGAVDGELVVSTPRVTDALDEADVIVVAAPLTPEDRGQVERAAEERPVLDVTGMLGGAPVDAWHGAPDRLPAGIHASPAASSRLVAALARTALAAGAKELPVAVVLEPASEMGQGAVDELYEQAVAMLNFKELPVEIFRQQAVHDVASPGPGGEEREATVRVQLAGLLGREAPPLLLLRPGTFHGVAAALHARVAAAPWRAAIEAEARLLLAEDPAAVTPVRVVGEAGAVVGRLVDDGSGGAWAWAAADSLRDGAVGNAVELLMRPAERPAHEAR